LPEGKFPLRQPQYLNLKEKAHEYHSTYYLGSIIIGRPAGLALQPQLGIRRQWDRWVPSAPGHSWLAVQLVLKMTRPWIVILLLTGVILAACGSSQTNPVATQANPALENVIPPDVALNVQNFIVESMGVAAENIEIRNVEQKDWPDGCLGLPEGDEACVEAITPGWLLTFNINEQEYNYRVDQTGTVIRQEP
jgi:hypothetical protein